tara:strand:+ start:391 stop:984 length:594 start_codon:yes stop_codon:yes gene_type:complete
MPFQSLEQAYFLYNYKRVAFNQIAGAYGVPNFWHEYRDLRDRGIAAKDAEKMIHDPRIKKWQRVLKQEDGVRFHDEVSRLFRTPNYRLSDEEILTKIKYLRRGYNYVYDRQKKIDEALTYRKTQLAERRKIEREKKQSKRKNIVDRRSKRTIIDNYFEMYRNQGKGQPTLEDIKREEGRPLTVEEESSYYKKTKGEQ